MTELTAENLTIETTQDGRAVIEPGYLSYLREHGYVVEDIGEAHTVDSDSREMSHIVLKIQTYQYPRNHEKLDYAAHGVGIWVCSCEDFTYNRSADVSESGIGPDQCGVCKHCRSVSKVEKAKNDKQQDTIV